MFPTDFTQKKGLNGCQSLEILDLSNNSIKELTGLQFCVLKELKILKLSHNEITKVEHLDNLKQIKELDLNHNRIRQFESHSFIAQNPVKCLKIESNGLKNFNHIQRLYKLQVQSHIYILFKHLFANSNRINDIPDIEKLTELAYLKELELSGNALSRRPGYR
jgi:Leucine-rich repeat (LRR) protein